MSAIRRMLLVDEDHINMVQKFGSRGASDPNSGPSSSSSPTYEDTIIADLPKTLRNKGAALVAFFKRHNIGYDEGNRMTYKGTAIPGSNYRDLLSDLVRWREIPSPVGFENLARILKGINVGRELITNLARYKFIEELPTVDRPEEESTGRGTKRSSQPKHNTTRKRKKVPAAATAAATPPTEEVTPEWIVF